MVKVSSKCREKITHGDLEKIVTECRKQRFQLEERDTGWFIRANQGHTLRNVENLQLSEILSFTEDVIHGTTKEPWEIIKVDGIR